MFAFKAFSIDPLKPTKYTSFCSSVLKTVWKAKKKKAFRDKMQQHTEHIVNVSTIERKRCLWGHVAQNTISKMVSKLPK